MEVKVYKIEGIMKLRNVLRKQKFCMYVSAIKKEDALEKIYSLLGGNHKVKRNEITITEIKELKREEVDSNPSIAKKLK